MSQFLAVIEPAIRDLAEALRGKSMVRRLLSFHRFRCRWQMKFPIVCGYEFLDSQVKMRNSFRHKFTGKTPRLFN